MNQHKSNLIKKIYLNNFDYDDIKDLPIKLQIFFILKFFKFSKKNDYDFFNALLKKYKETEFEKYAEYFILEVIDNISFEIIGLFFNTKVSSVLIKNDYLNIWENIVDSCVNRQSKQTYFKNDGRYINQSLTFDIIIELSEIFNLPIKPNDIRKIIKLHDYNEDKGIYLLKSGKIKFHFNQNGLEEEHLKELMRSLEIMYVEAVDTDYKVLAEIIRNIPCFVSYLSVSGIKEILNSYPETLNFNLNYNQIHFNILENSYDVISIKLKNLSNDDSLKEFRSTNLLLSVILSEKIKIPFNESYNRVFYSYFNKINSELGNNIEYIPTTDYGKELLDLHITLMRKPLTNIN